MNISKFLFDGSNRAYITSNLVQSSCKIDIDVTWSTMKQKIITEYFGFVSTANNFFFQTFNAKIFQLFESGLARQIVENEKKLLFSFHKSKISPKAPLEENSNVVLTLYHFQPWFNAYLGFLSIAFAVFVVEIIAKKLSYVFKR